MVRQSASSGRRPSVESRELLCGHWGRGMAFLRNCLRDFAACGENSARPVPGFADHGAVHGGERAAVEGQAVEADHRAAGGGHVGEVDPAPAAVAVLGADLCCFPIEGAVWETGAGQEGLDVLLRDYAEDLAEMDRLRDVFGIEGAPVPVATQDLD